MLATVLLPFLGLAWFVDHQVASSYSRIVLASLKGLAKDLASRVDGRLELFRRDAQLWAASPNCAWAIGEHTEASRFPEKQVGSTMRSVEERQLNLFVETRAAYDLVLVIDHLGQLVVSNTIDRHGQAFAREFLQSLKTVDYSQYDWFADVRAGDWVQLDQHRSPLLAGLPPPASRAEEFGIGIIEPVRYPYEGVEDRIIGCVFMLANWSAVQVEIATPVVKDYFRGLLDPTDYPSAYAWIWSADADTIIGHERPELYGQRVSREIGLPQLTAAALGSEWGLYPEYTFQNKRKNAAFKHCLSAEQGGFGWIVGVGIDNDDIFGGVRQLRSLLQRVTAVLLLLAVLSALVLARRTTAPIRLLQVHARRVSDGDLDARVDVGTRDELGQLAGDLNAMSAELKEHRIREVKAEKDAAWREMARQVAHDIKNPLTPIKLSIDLLQRAKRENSPQFDRIFERTVDTVGKQVDHLRDIANDFHALTGVEGARPTRVDVAKLLGEVVDLDLAWAEQLGVKVERAIEPAPVLIDPALLRRVFVNLLSNALQSMPDGGTLSVALRAREGLAQIEITDSGSGIPSEVRGRLFEPYFTTRSGGTGLGLAIAKRVIDSAGGSIELEPAPSGQGTRARVELPLDPA